MQDYLVLQKRKIPGACLQKHYSITMQLPLFQLKLKITQLLHRHGHFVFTLQFPQYSTNKITLSRFKRLKR